MKKIIKTLRDRYLSGHKKEKPADTNLWMPVFYALLFTGDIQETN
jgi:hypothetical protein